MCAGCSACQSICPADAIHVDVHSAMGPFAAVDDAKCIRCNRCSTVCPQLHPVSPPRYSPYDCYAVMAEDSERIKSASGGAFPVLAKHFLKGGGWICGVVWQGLSVKHVLISRPDELDDLRGSKYMRSDLEDILPRIVELLKRGEKVLFVGCPCQVAGLYAFVGTGFSGLVTVELICHYAPGSDLFMQYLKSSYAGKTVEKYHFRNKAYTGWNGTTAVATLAGGRKVFRSITNDVYQQGYHKRLFMPEVCESCHYSGAERVGDITIGDFWHIDRYDKALDDGLGTSIVLVQSEAGRSLWEAVIPSLKVCKKVPGELLFTNRPAISHASIQRDRFLRLLTQGRSFDEAVRRCAGEQYDIGVVGVWSEPNYGSELTYYTLYRVLVDMGLEPLMIERPASAPWKPQGREHTLFRTLPYPPYALAEPSGSLAEMRLLNQKCRAFLVGSDQMWHPQLYQAFGKFSFLDFVQDGRLKLAYSTSFGTAQWDSPPEVRQEIQYALKRFDAISVREESGTTILEECFGIQAGRTLDPVLLCPKEVLTELAQRAEGRLPAASLGVYLLDITTEKAEAIRFVSQSLGLAPSIISDARKGLEAAWLGLEVRTSATMEEWLENFIGADFVMTDSYHGVCLSILFHKPFIAIPNRRRGADRFHSLLGLLGLVPRLLEEPARIAGMPHLLEPIDFEQADRILEKEQAESQEWLCKALSLSKEEEYTAADHWSDAISEVAQAAQSLEKHLVRHEETLLAHGKMLLGHDTAISEQAQRLKDIDSHLASHQETLEAHGKMLLGHDAALSEQVQQLMDASAHMASHQGTLEAHGKMLLSHDGALSDLSEQAQRLDGAEERIAGYQKALETCRKECQRLDALVNAQREQLGEMIGQARQLHAALSALENQAAADMADIRQQAVDLRLQMAALAQNVKRP